MRPRGKNQVPRTTLAGGRDGGGVTEDKYGLSGEISELLPIGPHDVPIINSSAVTKLVRIEKEGWKYGGKGAP